MNPTDPNQKSNTKSLTNVSSQLGRILNLWASTTQTATAADGFERLNQYIIDFCVDTVERVLNDYNQQASSNKKIDLKALNITRDIAYKAMQQAFNGFVGLINSPAKEDYRHFTPRQRYQAAALHLNYLSLYALERLKTNKVPEGAVIKVSKVPNGQIKLITLVNLPVVNTAGVQTGIENRSIVFADGVPVPSETDIDALTNTYVALNLAIFAASSAVIDFGEQVVKLTRAEILEKIFSWNLVDVARWLSKTAPESPEELLGWFSWVIGNATWQICQEPRAFISSPNYVPGVGTLGIMPPEQMASLRGVDVVSRNIYQIQAALRLEGYIVAQPNAVSEVGVGLSLGSREFLTHFGKFKGKLMTEIPDYEEISTLTDNQDGTKQLIKSDLRTLPTSKRILGDLRFRILQPENISFPETISDLINLVEEGVIDVANGTAINSMVAEWNGEQYSNLMAQAALTESTWLDDATYAVMPLSGNPHSREVLLMDTKDTLSPTSPGCTRFFNMLVHKHNLVGPGDQVLDACAGSGVTALLAKTMGAESYAADLSPRAFETIKRNAEHYGIPISNIFLSDMFADVTGKYDKVFVNPPFPDKEQTSQRNLVDANKEGLPDLLHRAVEDEGYFVVKKFFTEVRKVLKEQGVIYVLYEDVPDSRLVVEYKNADGVTLQSLPLNGVEYFAYENGFRLVAEKSKIPVGKEVVYKCLDDEVVFPAVLERKRGGGEVTKFVVYKISQA